MRKNIIQHKNSNILVEVKEVMKMWVEYIQKSCISERGEDHNRGGEL